MKIILSFLAFLLVNYSQAQQSYDFARPLPPESQKIKTVARTYYGYYDSKDADIDYEITAKGIFAVSTIYSSISRETIRESSKYRVENGYLFGVKENDSIPCILEGEEYFFGIKYREMIIGDSSKNVLTKISDKSYIINFEENGHYTPSLFEFKGKSLSVRHFTYENATSVFNTIQERDEVKKPDLVYVTLEPTLAEWNSLPQKEMLGDKIVFTAIIE